MDQIVTERWLICRICLKSECKKLYNIFEPIDEEEISYLGTALLDKIELCGAIKLNQQYNLPNKICNRCVLLLRAAYRFRGLCQQSQNQLKQFITPLPQKQEPDETIDINFDYDAKEQNNEIQQETGNGLLADADYIIEESMLEYDDNSYEPDQSLIDKSDDILSIIDEDNIEIQEISDDGNSQYVVEEVNSKGFISEGNDYEVTTFEYDGDLNCDIIIEEHHKVPASEIITKSTNEKKPAAKRKQKYSHVEKVNKYYSCIYCDNSYTDKTKYNNHIKIHVKDKPHECEICKKRFTTTPQLSRHMNSHTGNRPYKCQYCEASFGDPSTKIKHERIHTNERPYKCVLCNKSFGYSNVLKVHMMTHTGEKPHTCELCGRAFSQLHHKNAHEKRHTKVNMVIVQNSNEFQFMEEDILDVPN